MPSVLLALSLTLAGNPEPARTPPALRLATFSADVTVPIGHPLMGGGVAPAQTIVDPLEAVGLVLLPAEQSPIVVCIVDWCEIRNDAYDAWRTSLAEAIGTTPERVLVSAVHQHDAPVADLAAERLLRAAGAEASVCDPETHRRTVARVARAAKASLAAAKPVTHLGVAKARVERVASNRRYEPENGPARYDRMSTTRDDRLRQFPEGTVDPWLRMLVFHSGDQPLAALSTYATHPMSYYGRGGVSADFVGLARRRFQVQHPGMLALYGSGCSGNITAGKYNDGSAGNRLALAERLLAAMRSAWDDQEQRPIGEVDLTSPTFVLPPRDGGDFDPQALERNLREADRPFDRCLAALGLSWRQRVEEGRPLALPCLTIGDVAVLLMPAESYVEFQLRAQEMVPDRFVLTLGYGECGPGYIPIERSWREDDTNLRDWCWVAPGAEDRMMQAIARALGVAE